MKKLLILGLCTLSTLVSAMDQSQALAKAQQAITQNDIETLVSIMNSNRFTSAHLKNLQKTAAETRWYSMSYPSAILASLGGSLILAGLWFDTTAPLRLYTCDGLAEHEQKYCSYQTKNSTGLILEYYKSLIPTFLYCTGALMTTAALCGTHNTHKVVRSLLASKLHNALELEEAAQLQTQTSAGITDLRRQISTHLSTISTKENDLAKAAQRVSALQNATTNHPQQLQDLRTSSQTTISSLSKEIGELRDANETLQRRLRSKETDNKK